MNKRHTGVLRKRSDDFIDSAGLLRGAFDAFRVSPGDVLFREGDAGDRMYVVLEGQVDIRVGETVVENAGQGSIVGEMALIDDGPRAASVVAATLSRLVAVDRAR